MRQARQARKLDVSHVATALRLTPQVVEAIERDDYAPLPSATFVSGYIRSYARLVGLDPEPLNQSFRRLHPNAEPPPRHFARSEQNGEQTDGGGLAGALVLALIVLAAAAGGYAWWTLRSGPDEPAQQAATPDPSAPPSFSASDPQRELAPAPGMDRDTEARSPSDRAPSVVNEPPTEADSETGSEPTLGTSPDVRMAEPGAEPPTSATDPIPEVADSPALESTPADSTVESPSAPLPTPPSPEVERPASSATQTPADDEEEAVSAPADSSATAIELGFTGPCWVDIRDATGEVLLFGEMSRGDRETLAGEPPYSLVIGNAAAVELTVGGAPYDLRSVARGNVARFELDPAEISSRTPDATD
nr:RodZ domain-containing protein [Halochromatium salexigens]